MASSMRICLATLVVLFAVFQIATSLKCFQCGFTSDCKTNSSVPCGKDDVCYTVRDSSDKIVIGDCGSTKLCDLYKYCSTCKDKDNCNSSSSVTPSFIIMGIVGAIIARYNM